MLIKRENVPRVGYIKSIYVAPKLKTHVLRILPTLNTSLKDISSLFCVSPFFLFSFLLPLCMSFTVTTARSFCWVEIGFLIWVLGQDGEDFVK